MSPRCPTCNELLPPSGQCEACLLVSSILLTGDDAPAPAKELSGQPEDEWDSSARELSPATLELVNQKFPPPATELPNPLPRPLEDPLRPLGWYVLGSLALVVTLGLVAVSSETPSTDDPPFLVTHGVWIASALFLFAIWRLLPKRRTDVLYLRSFRHDENTAPLRADLVRAFGPGVRVSGIRDPRRRSSKWLRQLNQFVFALRYSTPKYLNLEAGDDWKARLWRSLTLARGAILDVTDLTSYVKDEVRMCFRTLGLDRILFVGNGSKTVDQWRAEIATILELPKDAPIRVVLWADDRGSRAQFRADVSAYARQLPKRHPELSPVGSEIAHQDSMLEGTIDKGTTPPWVEVVVGGMLAGGVTSLLAFLTKLEGIGLLKIPIIFLALWFGFVQFGAFFTYLRECGTARERLLAALTMGLGLVALFAAGVAPGVWAVRLAAARMVVSDNLKTLAIAMDNYASANQDALPPVATYDKEGKPQLSWRVLILPYIGHDELYKQFKLNEPWDSPHNLQFIERMPKVFRHPGAYRTLAGYTHYRVFVTPLGARGASAAFRSETTGPRIPADFHDGTSITILIVEAHEAVPWTKPDELEYSADKPIPKLGGHFPGLFVAALADGSVVSLPTNLPEKQLRALITANGEDRIDGK
jgi:hypothetical protein